MNSCQYSHASHALSTHQMDYSQCSGAIQTWSWLIHEQKTRVCDELISNTRPFTFSTRYSTTQPTSNNSVLAWLKIQPFNYLIDSFVHVFPRESKSDLTSELEQFFWAVAFEQHIILLNKCANLTKITIFNEFTTINFDLAWLVWASRKRLTLSNHVQERSLPWTWWSHHCDHLPWFNEALSVTYNLFVHLFAFVFDSLDWHAILLIAINLLSRQLATLFRLNRRQPHWIL